MSEYYPLSQEVMEEINEEHPEHSRTSCSDENPCNYDAKGHYCWRCNALLMADYRRIKSEYKAEISQGEKERDETIKLSVLRGDRCRQLELDKQQLIIELGLRSEEELQARAEAEQLKNHVRELDGSTSEYSWPELKRQLKRLSDENSALKLQLSGRAYCHSDAAVNEDMKEQIEKAVAAERENELNACIEIATEAITHAGMDMTSVMYILGNLSARKLNRAIRAKGRE